MARKSTTEADDAENSDEIMISRRGGMKAGGALLLGLTGATAASSPAAAHHGIWNLESRGYKGTLNFDTTFHAPLVGPIKRTGYVFNGRARGEQRVRIVQETRDGREGKISKPFTVSGEWEKEFTSWLSKAYDCFYFETV